MKYEHYILLSSDVFSKHFQSVFSITYPRVHWKTLREKYVIRTFKCIVLSAAPCTFINLLLHKLYNMTSPIPVISGVRQGCMLSPVIFLMILDEMTQKENQWVKGLYKCREVNPSRGENPEVKSWPSRMGVGHRASNPIPENKFCCEIAVKYSQLDIWKMNHAM